MTEDRDRDHDAAADQSRAQEGLPNAREFSCGKILSHDGCGGECHRHRGQEQALHEPLTDAESRLGVRAEGADQPVDHHQVHEHEREFAAGRQSDTQQPAPNRRLRTPRAHIERHVLFQAVEVHRHQHHADANRQRTCESGAGHPHGMAGAPARDQHRGQHRVQNHREYLHYHRRLHDARAAQRRTHDDQCKLQPQARQKPIQVLNARQRGGGIGTEGVHVRTAHGIAAHQGDDRPGGGQHQALIEDQGCVCLVLAADGLRDQRHRSHAQHLGQRKHQEHEVGGGADARDGRAAQSRHEIQIDEDI